MPVKNAMALKAAAAALLVAIVFAIYNGALNYGFVYDDNLQVVNNPWITDIRHLPSILTSHSFGFYTEKTLARTYRPMVFILYMAEYGMFGLNPWGWHLSNIVLHSINSIMVLLLVSAVLERGALRAKPGTWLAGMLPPFAAAMLFATHPANSETVAWVACVPELIYTFFCLTAFYLHVKSRKDLEAGALPPLHIRALPVILFTLALLSKETALSLPLFIFIYDYAVEKQGGLFSLKRIMRYAPYALAAAAYFAVRTYAVGGLVPGITMYPYLNKPQIVLNAVILLVSYLKALLIPAGMYPFQIYDPATSAFEARAMIALFLTALAPVLLFIFRKRLPPLYFAAFFMIITPILPVLYFPGILIHSFAYRYLYLPVAGFAFLAALLLAGIVRRARDRNNLAVIWGSIAVVAFVSVFYSTSVIAMNPAWKNEYSIWKASLDGSPDTNHFAYFKLGSAYLKDNMPAKAVYNYEKAAAILVSSPHQDSTAILNVGLALALAYRQDARLDDALRVYEALLKEHPNYPVVIFQAATAYQEKGMLDDAIALYKKTLKLDIKPANAKDAYINLGNCYAKKGALDEALSYYKEALRIDPSDRIAKRNMEIISKKAGKQ